MRQKYIILSVNKAKTNKVYIFVFPFSFFFNQVNEDIVMDNAPEIGCLINGLFLDGCAWCHDKNYLIESKDRILYDKMPTVRITKKKRCFIYLYKQSTIRKNRNTLSLIISCLIFCIDLMAQIRSSN